MAKKMKKHPCPKSKEGCEYGGNRAYNYGFVSGTNNFCRLNKKWTSDFEFCPKLNSKIDQATGKKAGKK